MQAGYREFIAIRERMNLPLLPTGALVVAWDEQQLAALPAIVQQAHDNGVPDVAQIDAAELYRREPQLAPGALAAVEVPGESVIDPEHAAGLPDAGRQTRRRLSLQYRGDRRRTLADRLAANQQPGRVSRQNRHQLRRQSGRPGRKFLPSARV